MLTCNVKSFMGIESVTVSALASTQNDMDLLKFLVSLEHHLLVYRVAQKVRMFTA